MAHYAFIDNNNTVVEVIVGKDENDIPEGITSWEEHYESFRNNLKCVRTSYNRSIRKNFAQVGYIYDESLDAFIPPKPYDSWIFDEEKCIWNSPVPYPNDGKIYFWDESNKCWLLS